MIKVEFPNSDNVLDNIVVAVKAMNDMEKEFKKTKIIEQLSA